MTEETTSKATEQQAEDSTREVSTTAIRESSLFKQQAAAFTKLKDELEGLKAAQEEKAKAEEVAALEKEQNYKEALSKKEADFTAKLSALEAEKVKLLADIEHKEITHGLLSAGAASVKASDFLASEYKSIPKDERPDLKDWIEKVKEDQEFSVFFGETKAQTFAANPDVGGPASRKSAKVDLTKMMESGASANELIQAALDSLK